jgi:lytic murein transglycosylase
MRGSAEGARRSFKLATFLFISFFLAAPTFAASKETVNAQFRTWIESALWPLARGEGVSRATFDSALGSVSVNLDLPDLVLPGQKPKPPKNQHQAEFQSPANYFNEKSISALVSGGKARSRQYAKALTAIEKKYGVPRQYLLAIWGRESGYGTVNIPYDAFDVLATKAFMSARKDFFQVELLAALQILEKGYMDRAGMKTSWAGALGQPQFMPSSYLKYAVDFDGDGKRDIWNSAPDTLASIANYLVQYGWQKGRGWGTEVALPERVTCALEGPDQGKLGSEWSAMGILRQDGQPFPSKDLKSENLLLLPSGRYGPAFLATPNFYVIKTYNISDLYALFISHVADRIAGGKAGFAAPWRPIDKMLRSDIGAMQKALQKKGYDIGNADGLPGFKTRRSIGDFQSKNGLAVTCYPSNELAGQIK